MKPVSKLWVFGVALSAALGSGLVGALAGYWAGQHQGGEAAAATVHPPASPTPRPVLYWYDPMVPEQHFDKPGLSPMGMQMVPKYAQSAPDSSVVKVDAATVQSLGVRVARVERRAWEGKWRVPATVAWNLRQQIIISARTDAIITRLHVRAPDTPVQAGAALADLLAPAWSQALNETDALRHAQSADARALQDAAQERLAALGITAMDARGAPAADGSVTLHAPRAGIVTTLDVREGQRVGAGQPLMTLNDLSSVWVEAAVPQSQAAQVHAGTQVAVFSDALPGQPLNGSIEALLPDIDLASRTLRARIVLPNPKGRLSPGQFVAVELHAVAGPEALAVPSEALITSGNSPRLIVALGGGRFRPVIVATGRTAAGETEITAGLTGDEQVVVSGQFLIDSEASLSGALDRLETPASQPAHSVPGVP